VKLNPAGAVTGLVLDANGEPVEGALVEAEGSGRGKRTTTDEKGEFRIGGLAPGRYPIKAVPNELYLSTLPSVKETRLDGSEELHHAPTYYPGSLTARSAGRVVVTAGGETGGVVIQLIRTPIVRIGGTVSGAPPGGNVVIRISRGTSRGMALVDQMRLRSDRSFEIWRLDPGQYSLTAEWCCTGLQHLQSAPAGIEIGDRNVDRVDLRLVAPSDVPGRVHFEEQPPRGQTDGQAQADRYVDLTEVNGGSNNLAAIGPDGSFILKGVEPGLYRVFFTGEKVFTKSLDLGPTHTEGGLLDLRYGSGGATLSIVASSAGGQISGTVDYISGDFTPSWGADRAAAEGRVMDGRGITWDLMAWGFTRTEGAEMPWATKSAVQSAVLYALSLIVAAFPQTRHFIRPIWPVSRAPHHTFRAGSLR